MYEQQLREPDPAKVRAILKDYQKYIINEKAYYATTLWWNRNVVSNTKVQGWNVSPSHYINNQLDTVWLQ
jgi:peptide/nickel transport system substrate-binding protein